MSEGESILLNDVETKMNLVDRIDQAVLHYNRAIAALKVINNSYINCYFNNVNNYRRQVLPRTIYNSKRNI